MGALGDILSFIATPLYYAISAVMIAWHKVLTVVGLDPDSGLIWALSIIGLTLVIRAALIPLFVKQIKSQRNMQLLQPKVKELQKKYGHDRQKLAEEQMKLYKDAGTNPFASCLPLLVQMPIFITLFHLLNEAARNSTPHGFLTRDLAASFGQSEIFGRIPLADSFWGSRTWGSNPDADAAVMVTALVLVLAMTATTFLTQRQLMSKNMPPEAMSGQYAQQQKLLLYVLPVAFGLGGVAFPIGVLLYWTTSNLWTMCQQFYIIRNNPAPGTPAARAKEERDRAKALAHGGPAAAALVEAEAEARVEEERQATRQQPKRQTKAQRQQSTKKPGGSGGTGGSTGARPASNGAAPRAGGSTSRSQPQNQTKAQRQQPVKKKPGGGTAPKKSTQRKQGGRP